MINIVDVFCHLLVWRVSDCLVWAVSCNGPAAFPAFIPVTRTCFQPAARGVDTGKWGKLQASGGGARSWELDLVQGLLQHSSAPCRCRAAAALHSSDTLMQTCHILKNLWPARATAVLTSDIVLFSQQGWLCPSWCHSVGNSVCHHAVTVCISGYENIDRGGGLEGVCHTVLHIVKLSVIGSCSRC